MPEWSPGELTRHYRQAAIRTQKLAQRAGWAIYKNYSNKRQFRLQDVDALGHPIYYQTHNASAAFLTQTNTLYKGGPLGLSLSGNSVSLAGKLGLWDGGRALSAHREFGGSTVIRIQHMDNTATLNDHTTHLAGTLIAQGINADARGMASGGTLRIWDYDNDIPEIATAAKDLLLSNHAYGPVVGWVFNPDRPGENASQKWEWWGNTAMSTTEDYQFGFYNNRAADLDRILYSNPYYLIVRSADNKRTETGPPANTPYYLRNTNEKSTLPRNRNDGYDIIAGEATAKNVLTVGAADEGNNPAHKSVSAYSGWGPTDDGRIKPDLLGSGLPMLSTLSSGPAEYGSLMGTSMASANVTGSLLLLQELYTRLKPGAFMRSATLRALVLHTASRIRPAGTSLVTPPDYQQGWGVLNAREAAEVLLNVNGAHRMQEASLLQGTTNTLSVTAQGNEPLLVTIAWTDPEGPATLVNPRYVNSRVPKLVNDLDLRVTDASGLTTLPWTLNPNRPEQPAIPGDNIRDNVEQLVIQQPVPGRTYTIRVSHKGELRYGSQPFSVVVTGLSRTACQLTVPILASPDTILCAGKTVSLTVGQVQRTGSEVNGTGLLFEWIRDGLPVPNSGQASYTTRQAGVYRVRATDQKGCMGVSRTVTIREGVDRPLLSPSSGQLLCAARPSVTLQTAGSATAHHEWLRDGEIIRASTGTSLSVSTPGTYSVRVTQRGCSALSEAVVVESTTRLLSGITPTDIDILLPRGSSVQLQAPAHSAYQYQWYWNDQPIDKADAPRCLVNRPGVYRLRISQQACSAFLPTRTIRWSGSPLSPADSLFSIRSADSTLLIMPNPVSDRVTVHYVRKTTTIPQVGVYAVNGVKVIAETPMVFKEDTYRLTLAVGQLPPGHYFIQVVDGPRLRAGQFVKY